MPTDEMDEESFWERFARLWKQSDDEEEKILNWEATHYSHTPFAKRTWRWLQFRQKEEDAEDDGV